MELNYSHLYEHILRNIHKPSTKHFIFHYAVLIEHKKTDPLGILTIGMNDLLVRYGYMTSKHAEIDAMLKINGHREKPKKMDLYVFGISGANTSHNSKPCFHCIEQLRRSYLNIINVYYSDEKKIIQKVKFSDIKTCDLIITSGMRRKIIHKIMQKKKYINL